MEELIKCMEEKMKMHHGIMKTSSLQEECGIDYPLLLELLDEGYLVRVKNGYYRMGEYSMTEDETIRALFPDGVLCLESALHAYGYISEKPFAYHIAIDKNTSKSRFQLDYPVVIPYYTEERVLEIGVTTILVGGCEMKIYDKDRLICDMLKYESKLDHEVFKEALQSYIKDPEKNVKNLLSYAKERKVSQKVANMIGVWL